MSSKIFLKRVIGPHCFFFKRHRSLTDAAGNNVCFRFRLERLEESLRDEDMSEATKTEKRLQHAVKETEFLRLRRSRLGVDDFDPIKVIGRGAFGEVRIIA